MPQTQSTGQIQTLKQEAMKPAINEKTDGTKSLHNALLMGLSLGGGILLLQAGVPILPFVLLLGGAFFAARAISFGRKSRRKKVSTSKDSIEKSKTAKRKGSVGMAIAIGAIAAGIAAVVGFGVLLFEMIKYS